MSDISVLHISTADNLGGSGRSAYKIHCGLRNLGIQSRMLVGQQATSDADVAPIRQGWLKLADRVASVVTESVGLQYRYLPSSQQLFRHPWYQQADIIQLYNTHGNYFSHHILPRISREKRIVWRLSDMWPMTGHCAYSGDCDKWKNGCHKCPHLQSYPAISRDTASLLWRQKKHLYGQSNIHVVAPSEWILDVADNSPLFASFSKSLIRNGIDCEVFKPIPQEWCRSILNIPHQGKAVLFIAHVVGDNSRKGSSEFLEAIQKMWATGNRDFFVMIVGSGALNWEHNLPCPVWRHDLVTDDEMLSLVFNAADLIVHPATAENLPNSVLEAMACEIPAVAFETGGIREIVTHKETGYLAPTGDIDGLAAGIEWVTSPLRAQQNLGVRCRKAIQSEFSFEGQTSEFAALYRQLDSAGRIKQAA